MSFAADENFSPTECNWNLNREGSSTLQLKTYKIEVEKGYGTR